MNRWFRLPVGELATAQPVSSIASHVGSFSCRFSSAKASNTPISVSTLRLRSANYPDKESPFASSSSSSSNGHGVVVTVPIDAVKGIRLQPEPELGLLSLLFVLSMVILIQTFTFSTPFLFRFGSTKYISFLIPCLILNVQAFGAFISLAVVSIPTMNVVNSQFLH